jgi:hypothetical protein
MFAHAQPHHTRADPPDFERLHIRTNNTLESFILHFSEIPFIGKPIVTRIKAATNNKDFSRFLEISVQTPKRRLLCVGGAKVSSKSNDEQ